MCELGRRVRRSRGPNRGQGGSYRRGRGKSQVSGGWGWDGNALPIGTQGWPGGRGEEGAPASGPARVGEPPRARTSTREGAGASRPGAARHPSPALHTKGPGDPASCRRRCRAGPRLRGPAALAVTGAGSLGPGFPRGSSGL